MSRTLLTFVFASASSRLHADIIISRLKQAVIPLDLISALYLPHLRPNSVLCWLNGSATRPMSSGDSACIAGLLRFRLGDHQGGSEPLAARLALLGLATPQCMAVEEFLLENQIVICVQAEGSRELSAIFRTMKETAAENVFVAETEVTRAVAASEWGVSHAAHQVVPQTASLCSAP